MGEGLWIDLGTGPVPYRMVRAVRRTIGLRIGAAGLEVRVPRGVSVATLEEVLRSKAPWILRKLTQRAEQVQEASAGRQAFEWKPGASIPFLGATVRLEPREDAPNAAPEIVDDRLVWRCERGLTEEAIVESQVTAWLRRAALSHFTARVTHFEGLLAVRASRVLLSQARTRWGSAARDGTIRLNWRLIHLRPDLVDYVVGHELAHLREMNHGPAFWALVERIVPDVPGCRKALREAARSTLFSPLQ